MAASLPRRARVAAALLFVAAPDVSPQTAPDVVRMIEADGTRRNTGRGGADPRGRGSCPTARIPIDGRRDRTSSGACRSPDAATRRRSCGAIASFSPPRTTADSGCRSLAFRRTDGKQLWETFVPQRGVEYGHPKNGHASATPVDRRPARLRVVRQQRSAGGRPRREDRVAPPGRPARATITAARARRSSTRIASSSTRTTTAATPAARSSPRSRPRPASRCGRRRATRASAGARRSSSAPAAATS